MIVFYCLLVCWYIGYLVDFRMWIFDMFLIYKDFCYLECFVIEVC